MHSPQHWVHDEKTVVDSRAMARRLYGVEKMVEAAVQVAEQRDGHTDLPIWTADFSGKTGSKFYTVLGVEAFFHMYSALPEARRTYYELIRHTRLCKLYFDVEFARHDDVTRSKSMDDVTAHIVERVRSLLVRDYGVPRPEDVSVVELDSSTDTKASRHLIFNVRNVVFETVKDVKCFVHMTFPGLQNVDSTEEDAVLLWKSGKKTRDGQDEVCHCIDGSVYTMNRSFRLWDSHKSGKPNAFHHVDGRAMNMADFVQSLVTTFPRYMRAAHVQRLRFDVPAPTFRRKQLPTYTAPPPSIKRPRVNRREMAPAEADATLTYHPTGTRESAGHWKHGLKEGRWTYWDEQGRPLREEFWEEGLEVSTWREWYPESGRVRRIVRWRRGVRHGECSEWDPLGQCVWRENYKGGKRHGQWVCFQREGRVLNPPEVTQWRDGQVVQRPERGAVYRALEPFYNRVNSR